MRPKIATAILNIVLTTLVLAGCINPFGPDRGIESADRGGQLTVRIATLGASSVVPDLSLLVAGYAVTLTRDGQPEVSASGSATTFAFDDLASGTWNVTVQAQDSAGGVIGVGSSTVEISPDGSSSAVVSISTTTDGTGGMDLSVTWPAGEITEIRSATIAPLGGDPVNINEEITGLPDLARYTADHPSGVYELVALFGREGAHVATLVVAVHVFDNVTTTASIQLTTAEIGQAPAPPTGLSIIAGAHWVTLTWTDVSPVNNSYEIQRREDGDSEWQNLAIDSPLGATATEYVDEDVTPRITYRYRIRGVNSFGPTSSEEGWVEFDPITTAQLAAPTLTLPEKFLPGGKIELSTNRPSEVRYYYTTNGTNPTFTNPVFDPHVDDSGPDTTAVWQFAGIVLNDPGEYELRVLARSEGWLDSPITTQSVTVSPKWTESDGTWVVNPGISWNDFLALIDLTADGDTITWSGDATIALPGTTAPPPSILLKRSVTFDAGGYTVVIDGIQREGINWWIGFFEQAADTVVRFEGLTVRNFHSKVQGGFLRVPPDVTVEFRNVRLENNLAGATGQGSVNSAGGAIANEGGTVLIEDSLLIGNRGLGGGAVVNFSGTTTIRRSRFLNNRVWINPNTDQVHHSGGAILAIDGSVNVVDSFFTGNSIDSNVSFSTLGGALSARNGTINVQGSQFVGNESDVGAAAYVGESGTLRFSSSAFYDNRSTRFNPTENDSIIDAREQPSGLELHSSTFVENTILTLGTFSENATGHNLLVVNTPTGLGEFETSFLQEEVAAADIFVALPDTGPDGVWGTNDDLPGDFRLRDTADPAIRAAVIDAGDNNEIAYDFADANENGNFDEDEPYDLAGNPRVQGGTIDIGAVEH